MVVFWSAQTFRSVSEFVQIQGNQGDQGRGTARLAQIRIWGQKGVEGEVGGATGLVCVCVLQIKIEDMIFDTLLFFAFSFALIFHCDRELGVGRHLYRSGLTENV